MNLAHRRHDISDPVWSRLEPHLPGRKGTWCGIARDNRQFINAVFWIVRFISTADLMLQLSIAKKQEHLEAYLKRSILSPKLFVIGEIGYLPFGRAEANLFFNVIAKRYEQGRVMVTSNLPFSQCSTAFADDQTLTAALLDRLLHHAHIVQISGNSYRLKGKKQQELYLSPI